MASYGIIYILGVGFTVVKFNEEQGCLDTFIEHFFFFISVSSTDLQTEC